MFKSKRLFAIVLSLIIISVTTLPTFAASVTPNVAYTREFDHYDANYVSTSDTCYFMGEHTTYNFDYSQPCSCTYVQSATVTASASFNYTVTTEAAFKTKVVQVGTSVAVGGTLSASVSVGFTTSTGYTVSPRYKRTVGYYYKGQSISGAKIYRIYDEGHNFGGYQTDTYPGNWFPKLNCTTTVVQAQVAI